MFDYTGATSPAGTVESLARTGFNLDVNLGIGDWLGKGITSSVAANPSSNGNYTLAAAENKNLTDPFGSEDPNDPNSLNPKFTSEDVDLTAVLVKFTNRVDLDLNGKVDGNDTAIFNSFYDESLTQP